MFNIWHKNKESICHHSLLILKHQVILQAQQLITNLAFLLTNHSPIFFCKTEHHNFSLL